MSDCATPSEEARTALADAVKLDELGDEVNAAASYELALQGKLVDGDLRATLLGLGSTYRNLGRLCESEKVLRRGLERFPDGSEFVPFLALTLLEQGRPAEAVAMLLQALVACSDDYYVQLYRRAITQYADALVAPSGPP